MIKLMVKLLLKKFNKIVISPGPGNPNQAGNCLKIVKDLYKKIPDFGCLFRSPDYWTGIWWKNYKCEKFDAWQNK